MPNWFAANQYIEASTDETNAVLDYSATYSPETSTPIKEGLPVLAEAVANCSQADWAEGRQLGLNPATKAANWEQTGQRSYATAEVVIDDVALTNDEVATEKGGSPGDVAINQEDASEWLWTILAQSGYERW